MKTNKQNILTELPENTLKSINGGGEADDLAYRATHLALATNPIYWMLRFSVWAVS